MKMFTLLFDNHCFTMTTNIYRSIPAVQRQENHYDRRNKFWQSKDKCKFEKLGSMKWWLTYWC